MNLLRIDSSVRVEGSVTRELTDFFIGEIKKNNDVSLCGRDVGINIPDIPSNEFIAANYTPKNDRSVEMKKSLKFSDALIGELVNAEKIVIASPMYNFSISTPLKAYIDNIVRIGETFLIDDKGDMKGLLSGKQLLVITSRGAMSYEAGENLHAFDFQENYLKAVFSFLGITDIRFVHTEAQDFGSTELKDGNYQRSKHTLVKLSEAW